MPCGHAVRRNRQASFNEKCCHCTTMVIECLNNSNTVSDSKNENVSIATHCSTRLQYTSFLRSYYDKFRLYGTVSFLWQILFIWRLNDVMK